MAYILDLAVILIFVLCLVFGWRRGFVRMVIKLAGLIAAVLIASSLCGPLADWTYDVALDGYVTEKITAGVEESGVADLTETVQSALASLPEFIGNMLNTQGVSAETVAHSLSEDTAATSTADEIAVFIADRAVRPVLLLLLKGICFILLVLVLMLVVGIVSRLLRHVMKLPVLRQIDQTLGLLLGILEGVLWSLVAVAVIDVIAATGGADALINPAVVDQTFAVHWILGFNPITALLRAALDTLSGVL